MNQLSVKQILPEMPFNERILELSERAASLGEQLCFVRWDTRVYDTIMQCLSDLDNELGTQGGTPQLREQLERITTQLSGFEVDAVNADSISLGTLAENLQQMKDLARGEAEAGGTEPTSAGKRGLTEDRNQTIVFLGEDRALDEHIRWLENSGFVVRRIGIPEKLQKLVVREEPVALVIDLSCCEDEYTTVDYVAAALKKASPVPRVVFISERADQEIRLQAIQAGGDAFLTRPVTPQELMQHLELAVLTRIHGYRVMLVDDSNGLASSVAPRLERAGMTVKCLGNVSQALLSVINFSPDLLVINEPLKACSGYELGRVIHQLADYEDTPVVYTGTSRKEAGTYRLDYACEWVNPDFLGEGEFIPLIDRLVGTSRLRKNRIRQLQTCDPVTGLLNRQGFFQLLDRGVMVDDTCALVLVDIDNLQRRYPQLSPLLMNKFLVMIASQLGKLAASSDLSARVGDYTFAYLIQGKTPDEVRKIGQFLSHSLSARIFDIEEHSLMVACSVGIAISSERPDDALPLFTLALSACEEAYSAGNNRVSVRTMDAAPAEDVARDEKKLLALLQDALSNDLFQLVYQPIASLCGNGGEKYEALLRLHDRNNGGIPPSKFLPVAERNGLMESIDRWVVEHTIQALQKSGNDGHFFVKVSSATLHDSEFMSFLKKCLARYDVDGGRLVFEVNASGLRDGIRYASEFAAQVSRQNCNISIEHLDARQDVTQLLEHIPASYVKLDGAALQGLMSDPVKQERLKDVIRQAEQKSARTIAGFVEDAGCLQLLWQSGVHYIQGDFLQKPDESLGFEFGVEGTVQENFPDKQ